MPKLIRLRWLTCLLALGLLVLGHPARAAAQGQGPDTDGDGMPDAWETFFGLDPGSAADAAGDPDGDGLTNLQEYTAGRHPFGRFARYFAEGSTGYFSTSLAVLNLSPTDTAHVNVTLLDESGAITSHRFALGPRQRQSVPFETVLPRAAAVSIIVESETPIAADRVMTWGTSGIGQSLDSGAEAPATTWYFAEGATGPFLLYYLFENPGGTAANISVRYLREGGAPITKTRTLPPHSRTTVFVNDEDPALAVASLGMVVTSDLPILAERAMYLNAGNTFGGGSASSGTSALSPQWYFGEGATGPFFHAFLSMMNPGATPATATVTYHMSDGSTASKTYDVPAAGRRTVYFNDEGATDATLAPLANGPVWFTVTATQPIAAERAMWWSTWPWYEGHAATGSIASDVAWGVAEGRHGGALGDQTYVLIGNTTGTAGQVRVSLIPDSGSVETRDLTIAAGARLTIDVGELFGLGESRFSVTVESLGATPVPLAVDYARYRSVAGLPFSGGGAAPAVPLLPGDAAPAVTATTPADGATGVSPTADLVVQFSEPVDVTSQTFALACPAGTPVALQNLTITPASTQFTLHPQVPYLPPATTCTLTVAAGTVHDSDTTDPPDVMTADAVVTFTTAPETAPSVTATTPVNGATSVGTTANLTITFSEPVAVAGNWFQIVCGTSGTRNVSDTAVTGGPTVFTITPNAPFAPGEACATTIVAAAVTDQDAIDPPDAMAANVVVGFTIDQAPSVTSTTPANGAVQVATTTNVTLTFSEAVTATASSFTIACTTSGAHSFVLSGGPTLYTLNPDTDFTPGETCTVTALAAQISDQDAADPPDTMAANYVFSFTIDSAPAVFATSPVDGATGISTAATVTVTFTESVNAAGGAFALVCDGTPVAFSSTASPATSYTLTPTGGLPAGTICTVTVNAALITDVDAGDPPDAMLANHVFSFSVPPDAGDDVRGVTGNVSIDTTTTGFSVLANDAGSNLAVTAFDPTSVRGGTVSVDAAGRFTYTPPVGYEGPDSFTYTISNPAGSDTATVSLSVSGMVWFIDNSGPACTLISAGCGRRGTPFTSLLGFNTVNGGGTMNGGDVIDPEPGDTIFLFTGNAPYIGPLVLLNSQRVISQGATSSLGTLAGIAFAPDSVLVPSTGGTRPTITSVSSGVFLALDNQLHAIDFLNTGGVAIAGAAGVGTFQMNDIGIANATGGGGVMLANGGTVTAGGINTISTTTGIALSVQNTQIAPGNLTFRSISSSGAAKGIVLTNTGQGIGHGGLVVTGTVGDGSGGTIQNASQRGIELSSTKAVSLKNMVLFNASTTDAAVATDSNTAVLNAAIYMSGVAGASFDNVDIAGTNQQGIIGVDVSDFTLVNSTIIGAGDGDEEGALKMRELTGTVTLTNDDFSFSAAQTVEIKNTAGSLLLNLNGVAMRDTQASANGQGGLQVITTGTTAVHPSAIVNVVNSTFQRLRTHGVNVQSVGTTDAGWATSDVDITGTTFDPGAAPGTMIGIDLDADDASTLVFNVVNNPQIDARNGPAVNIFGDVSARVEGRIVANVVRVLDNPGNSQVGSAVRVNTNKDAAGAIQISSNVISNAGDDAGIEIAHIGQDLNTGQQLDVTISANQITLDPSTTYGVFLLSASGASDQNVLVANVVDNTVINPGAFAFRARAVSPFGGLRMQGFSVDPGATWDSRNNLPVGSTSFGGSGSFGIGFPVLPSNPTITPVN
jgi:methionine-rich copper-binding protein CopC